MQERHKDTVEGGEERLSSVEASVLCEIATWSGDDGDDGREQWEDRTHCCQVPPDVRMAFIAEIVVCPEGVAEREMRCHRNKTLRNAVGMLHAIVHGCDSHGCKAQKQEDEYDGKGRIAASSLEATTTE